MNNLKKIQLAFFFFLLTFSFLSQTFESNNGTNKDGEEIEKNAFYPTSGTPTLDRWVYIKIS